MSDMIRQINRYLDDDLSDNEIAQLFGWVAADQANDDQFARLTLLDQHASELLSSGDIQLPDRSQPSHRRRFRSLGRSSQQSQNDFILRVALFHYR